MTSDCTCAVSAGADHTVIVWGPHTGECVQILEGHTGEVYGVDINKTGNIVISASKDHTIKLWDLEKGMEVHTFEGHNDDVFDVIFTDDDLHAISASADHTVRIWDLVEYREIACLEGHEDKVVKVDYSSKHNWIISGGFDKTLRVWNIESKNIEKVFTGVLNSSEFVLTNDGSHVLLDPGGYEIIEEENKKIFMMKHQISKLDLITNKNVNTWDFPSRHKVLCAMPDGHSYIREDGFSLQIWDSNKESDTLALSHSCGISDCAISGDGKLLMIGDVEGGVNFYDLINI